MRFVLILLLLAACAPVAASSPTSTVQSSMPALSAVEEYNVQPPASEQIPSFNSHLPTLATSQPTIPTSQSPVSNLQSVVSESRLRADLLTLQNFHTRHSASTTNDANIGIGAARAWLIAQFKSISPRLQVETDDFAFTLGNRPVAAQNIIATLPCKTCKTPETSHVSSTPIIVISAHYDSRTVDITDTRTSAPGANDDGSGTVAALELARALIAQDLDVSIVFILFAGEEEGLYGSTHLAPLMRKNGAHIIAMLNNDIIGNTTGSDGTHIADRVRVFSGDPDDSPSRQLAREVKRVAERAMPDFTIDLIPKIDRRGGDHIPFHYAGFPAVRFTEAIENLEHQHNANDRVEFMDIAYLAKVVRVNLIVALELAKSVAK